MENTSHLSARLGRPREFDSDAVLDKAITRFSEFGYHGTSISDLNKVLGLTSGSIYKAWGDKRGLFLAALGRYMELRAEALRQCIASADTGRGKIEAVLKHYAQMSSETAGRTGCLVIETAVELSVADAEIATRIAAQQQQREAQLRRLIEEAQRDGSVRTDLDAALTAKLLMAIQQGMRILGKTGAIGDDMQRLVPEAMRLFD
ncbi:TetR/AcrR family transcriptional regulator [Pseudomonas frederiksbergensis]|uniref:TetR family transcriptional regulator n=1 Tax=Pseudomonas frederiksbergensis TaxID=104087 RepID=A0A423KR43_9PSED|nr:TetR/AcrR family transcriptional regulator [Pseudomonas frederiksbergensis]RON57841.1 TetR family transcriptional regulator [Pseudomonas frederiksbergensis]